MRRILSAVLSIPLLAFGLGTALVLQSSPAGAVDGAGSAVFINEIHYDNTGGDVGEFVEIAGPAGTDLTGWTIQPYNGNGGAPYSTTALSGTIDDEGAGSGATSFAIAGLQNGGPDGIALISPDTTVVQFLSYEGAFTAVGGPADGLTSTDIGVSEASSTPIGESLQLIDGIWTGPATESPGELNSSATGPTADLFISEFHYDNDGGDVGEFVEITGPAGTDLTGWTIQPYNGNGGAPYSATALAGTIDDENGTDGAVAFPIAGLQNGGPDGLALIAPDASVIEFLSYEGSFTAAGGPADGLTSTDVGVSEASSTPIGESLQLIDGIWTGPAANTEGDLNEVGPPGACDTPTFIHDIQGSGTASPCVGDTVTVTGIVTALFEDNDTDDGFFLQEEDANADADPATSEGIFVFCRTACPTVAPGDQMTVTGDVAEFFGMTQIDAAFGDGIFVAGPTAQPLPAPTSFDLPASGSTLDEATFESLEGMLVQAADTLVVSEYFELARYGQLVLTETARPYQFTHTDVPSDAGYAAFLADLAAQRIILDDDNNDQNDAIFDADADEAYYQPGGGLSTTNVVRGGDTIDGLTAVLHWSFAGQSGTDAWRLRPIPQQFDYSFTSANPRPASPDDVGGRLTAVSFNVLNYFTTLDEPGAVCGPSALGCRGAHSVAEFERQEAKIVAALLEIDADIVGLIEIENNATASLQALVDALNGEAGAGTYDYVDTGTIGGDAIKIGLIYKPATVSPVGPFAILDSSVDPQFIDTKNRPMLTQTFEEVATGARVNVSVNHLKSKGSSCSDVGDPDSSDGSANCNGVRTDAAAAIVDYLAGDPTGMGDLDHLILGDLNAYKMETPITTLTGAGYTDLIEQFEGPDAYSFVFDGQLGYLDYALSNPALTPQITGIDEWHINADEINIYDYNDDVQDAAEASFERISEALTTFAPDAFRSSDHDPVIVGIDLDVPEPSYACGPESFTVTELEGLGYNVVLGTNGNDRLYGTSGPDAILGLAGHDRLFGRTGDDLLCGGGGADRLYGSTGNDILNGDAGEDRLYGGRHDDELNGGDDDDRLYAGSGDDQLDGGAATDVGYGSSGFDTCVNLETAFSCEA